MIKLAGVVVLTGAIALGPAVPVIAGPMLDSANRLAQQAGRQAPQATATATGAAAAQAAQGTLAESGMSRRKKLLIAVGAFVAAAVGMYVIDQGVEDNTPSSKGTRRD